MQRKYETVFGTLIAAEIKKNWDYRHELIHTHLAVLNMQYGAECAALAEGKRHALDLRAIAEKLGNLAQAVRELEVADDILNRALMAESRTDGHALARSEYRTAKQWQTAAESRVALAIAPLRA